VKASVFFLPLVLALVVLIAVLVWTPAGEPSPTDTGTGPEPVPTPTTTVEVERTVQGRTAADWHQAAARYLRRTRLLRHRIRLVIHSPLLPGHWLERSFLCIHAGEGSWGAATGNGYYGGLQMDLSFQRTYGAWALRAFGTADQWPASVQIATAIRAYTSGRGFYPWPNTARACGLIR
jgi:hypothetical protein